MNLRQPSTAAEILIIDDCPFQLTLIGDLLREAGYPVSTASSGIEANARIYGKIPPGLLLVDVEMPLVSGDRKVQLLKQRPASRQIPVILMSGKSAEEMKRLAAASGADAWLTKPLQREKLLELVRRLLPGR